MKIQGLEKRSELNGQTGICLEKLELGRWKVKLDSTSFTYNVAPANLKPLSEATGSAVIKESRHNKDV